MNKDIINKGVEKGLEYIAKYTKWIKKQKYSEEELEKIFSALNYYIDAILDNE